MNGLNLNEYETLKKYYDYMSDCVIIPMCEFNETIKNEIFEYMTKNDNVILTSCVDGENSCFSLIDCDTYNSYN